MKVIVRQGRHVMWRGGLRGQGTVLDVPAEVGERWFFSNDVDLVDELPAPPAEEAPPAPERGEAAGQLEEQEPIAEPPVTAEQPATPAEELPAVEELPAAEVSATALPPPKPAPTKRNKRSR